VVRPSLILIQGEPGRQWVVEPGRRLFHSEEYSRHQSTSPMPLFDATSRFDLINPDIAISPNSVG
jgi:hypothetical protein